MSDFELKCKNCGSDLTKQDDIYVCEHCGTRYEKKEDIIQNISTNNVTQNITKVYTGKNLDVDELLSNGDVFLKLNEYEQAIKSFHRVTELEPSNPSGWFGLVKAYTGNLSLPYAKEYELYYENAMKVANEEQRAIMFDLMQEYYIYVKGNLYGYKFEDPKINFMDEKVCKRKSKKLISDERTRIYTSITVLLGIIILVCGIIVGLVMMFTVQPVWVGLVVIIGGCLLGIILTFIGVHIDSIISKHNSKIINRAFK